jgi:hypothetical protein
MLMDIFYLSKVVLVLDKNVAHIIQISWDVCIYRFKSWPKKIHVNLGS